VDVAVPGGEHGNVQTNVGGDRVSTISLLGCSTCMSLATGPTDEEEEEEWHVSVVLCTFYITTTIFIDIRYSHK